MRRELLAVVLALGLCPLAAYADFVPVGSGDLIGSRTTPPASGVVAADGWTDGNGGFTISWEITSSTVSASGYWEYEYTIDVDDGPDLSHWLLEVSPIITEGNLGQYFPTGFYSDDPYFQVEGPVTWGADPLSPNNTSPGGNNGNPNLPADIYGLSFGTEQDLLVGFWSTQQPVWGDFYAKDGKHEGIVATAWNSGFGSDPDDSTTDFTGWIPVPDTTGGGGPPPVPEPASLILLMLGTSAVLGRRWLRRDS